MSEEKNEENNENVYEELMKELDAMNDNKLALEGEQNSILENLKNINTGYDVVKEKENVKKKETRMTPQFILKYILLLFFVNIFSFISILFIKKIGNRLNINNKNKT